MHRPAYSKEIQNICRKRTQSTSVELHCIATHKQLETITANSDESKDGARQANQVERSVGSEETESRRRIIDSSGRNPKVPKIKDIRKILG